MLGRAVPFVRLRPYWNRVTQPAFDLCRAFKRAGVQILSKSPLLAAAPLAVILRIRGRALVGRVSFRSACWAAGFPLRCGVALMFRRGRL